MKIGPFTITTEPVVSLKTFKKLVDLDAVLAKGKHTGAKKVAAGSARVQRGMALVTSGTIERKDGQEYLDAVAAVEDAMGTIPSRNTNAPSGS